MHVLSLALILVALILAIVELIRSKWQSLIAWAVALLALAFAWPVFPK